jgi:hypothetical protein
LALFFKVRVWIFAVPDLALEIKRHNAMPDAMQCKPPLPYTIFLIQCINTIHVPASLCAITHTDLLPPISCPISIPPFPSSSSHALLTQPHPPKQQYDRSKEPNPNFPPHTRLLRHSQHTIHSALDLVSRVFKLIVHLLGEGGGIADFVSDEMG